ncbi:MAG TPA: ABC transporter substrate-binding protein [Pseudogracilibacillus sp.]|nr:ABC transporter substrate-binding protein [Pseudogracilibacillus sp.]
MKRKVLLSVFISLMTVFVLAACATSGGNTNDDGNSSGGKSKSKDKNEVTVAFQENVQTLDPHESSSGIDISVIITMYESLLTPDQDGELEPLLAEDYSISDDGLSYTFQLREDVEFTDGEPFNAEAVKANVDRILDSEGAINSYKGLRSVDHVEVDDEFEVTVHLKDINSQFLSKIGNLRIISPKAIEEEADFSKESYGTGPFVLESWDHGDSVVVTKNEDYWEEGLPKVDKVTMRPIPEDGSRMAMLKTGEVDYAFPVPVNDVDELQNDDSVDVGIMESTYVNYVTINTYKEPYNDLKVRQAMNHAIDKEAYIKVVKNGYAQESDSPLPATNNFYEQQETYEYDLDKAKELLAEAGYPDGFEAEIWGSDSSKDKRGMEFIQQQLAEVGIDVEVKQYERATLSDEINNPESPDDAKIQMWYVGWSSTVGDADNAINPLFTTSAIPPNGSNTAYFSNDEVDELTQEALHAETDELAKEKYAELQEIIMEEAPWIFLGVDEEATAKAKGLDGIWRSADGNFYLRDVSWE